MTETRPMADQHCLLDDNLQPLWMFLRHNGLLPDFCRPSVEIRAGYIARLGITLIAVVLVLIMSLFLIVQLFRAKHVLDIMKISYNLVISLSAIFFQYQYLVNRNEYMKFCQDWRNIEIQFLPSRATDIRKIVTKLVYSFYLIILIADPLVIYIWNVNKPDDILFYSSHSWAGESLNLYFLSSFEAISVYYSFLYFYMGELVPALFYHHAGGAIESIDSEFRDTFLNGGSDGSPPEVNGPADPNWSNSQPRIATSISTIWEKYETILGFVNRANRLFGASILCHNLTGFLLRSISVYCILKFNEDFVSIALKLIFINITAVEIMRTVVVNRLMSHLRFAREQLLVSIAALMSQRWHRLPLEDRNHLMAFQTRLFNKDLAASPFDLYTVNPSNLLSTLSLIVTYIIVLLQIDI